MIIYRPDRKTVQALGGLQALRSHPVQEWHRLGRGEAVYWEPLSWRVPDEQAALLNHPPMGKEEVQALLSGN